jgi:hypothetical protein
MEMKTISKTRTIAGFLGCAIILAFFLNSCNTGTKITSSPPLISHGMLKKLTLDEIEDKANQAILGKVTHIVYQKDNNGNINTLVTFSIEQTFKGDAMQEMEVSVPGGKVDGQTLMIEDAPIFQLGERSVVFLENSNGIMRVVGGIQGEFLITEGNMVGDIPLSQFIVQVNNAITKQ